MIKYIDEIDLVMSWLKRHFTIEHFGVSTYVLEYCDDMEQYIIYYNHDSSNIYNTMIFPITLCSWCYSFVDLVVLKPINRERTTTVKKKSRP